MSEEKTLAGRSLAAFRRDPNFTGAFVGGPPLMSADEVRYILEHRDEIDREANAAIRRIRQQLSKQKKPPKKPSRDRARGRSAGS